MAANEEMSRVWSAETGVPPETVDLMSSLDGLRSSLLRAVDGGEQKRMSELVDTVTGTNTHDAIPPNQMWKADVIHRLVSALETSGEILTIHDEASRTILRKGSKAAVLGPILVAK